MTAPLKDKAIRPQEQILRDAAREYASCGWTAHPLVRDPDGWAKKPMFEDGAAWLRFRPEHNEAHPWQDAAGIGISLGQASGNLAAMDIDDAGLADGIRRHYLGKPAPPRMQTTPHDGLHVFAIEPEPSVSVDIEVRWQERWAKVQLLGRQRQVVVCPTRAYKWVEPDAEPLYGPVGGLWHALAREMGLYYRLSRYKDRDGHRDWSRRLP